ncbi:hypothetical protein [Hymenobacter swuensis]|uniref:Phage tail collar domain-containing protein n=1 Tax=Hymenobacter swuensis DY53 TaxID=1227739 RepID=W8F1Z3_9BACT|nr:hypothetical protein [Hymenobacter swuensis]AHJ98918.1 hypothetical protein Hsw_3323 [Hymenobacter swuensis DY53]
MQRLLFDIDGRPLANDDLETLQRETFAAAYAHLQDAPPLVLSGCQVSVQPGGGRGSIGPGYIWLAGEIIDYAGVADVALPAELVAGTLEESDPRTYQTGGTKNCMVARLVETQAYDAANQVPKIVFVSGPELTYTKWLESRTRTMGEVQWLANISTSQYDSTGKGYADLTTRGWALCNGQNGTADLRGRFVAGFDPAQTDYAAPGKTGGADKVSLTADQNAPHSHDINVAPFTPLQNSVLMFNQGNRSNNPMPGGLGSWGGGRLYIAESGGGAPHENRPPFYVLAARQWIGL